MTSEGKSEISRLTEVLTHESFKGKEEFKEKFKGQRIYGKKLRKKGI